MGRRPLAQKRQGKAPTAKSEREVTGPSGGVEKQSESSNPSSEQTKLQSEKSNPHLETIEPQPKTQTNSADLSSITKSKKHIALSMVRRSQRVQSAATPSQDKDIKLIIEEITLSESEKDEEPLNLEEGKLPEPILMQKSLEEKVDYLLQQFEEQQKTIESLKFKVTRDSSPTGSPRAADVRYRNLYFDSQKKIEALTDENHQLVLKLERALGKLEAVCLYNTILAQICCQRALLLSQEKKNHLLIHYIHKCLLDCLIIIVLGHIEALTDENHQLALKLERALGKLDTYENGACVFSEGLEKMKDMILVTNLKRATKTAVNFSSQAFTSMDADAEAKTTAKRKRLRRTSK
ncbi:hypothetical protein CRYUN_Cryun01aG0173700 [Craigia yunnanensis]